MTDPLVGRLAAGLRRRGVPVSVAEVIDAVHAVAWVGVDPQDRCRSALRATLVKHEAHDSVFDAVFDDVMQWLLHDPNSELPDVLARVDASASAAFDGESRIAPELPDQAERLAVGDDRHDDAASDGRLGPGDGPDDGEVMGANDVEFADAGRRSADDRGWHRLRRVDAVGGDDHIDLGDRRAVDEAARTFLRRHRHDARRFGPAHRGRLDTRATWRSARSTGGVPLALRRRGRVRQTPRVLVLVDVSVSVRPTARLALHTADALTRNSRGVRLVVFVDRAGEATAVVRRLPPDRAVAALYDGGPVDISAASDYGLALRMVGDLIGGWLDRRTTVLIFGDGRSNGADPGFASVESLVRRGASVHWYTPEPVGAWPLGFGEMQGYAERVTSAHQVRSLSDLVAVLVDGDTPLRPWTRAAPRRG